MIDWWRKYDDKIVGYVVEVSGKFQPFLAKCIPDGDRDLKYSDSRLADDCILSVEGSGPKFATAEDAVTYIEQNSAGIEIIEVFPVPIEPGMIGVSWLIEPYMKKYGIDPRDALTAPAV